MKAKIDIITGFLGSGKTSFINELLNKKTALDEEKTVVLQLERGAQGIEQKYIDQDNIYAETPDSRNAIQSEDLKDILKQYGPDRVLIEYNGTMGMEELFSVLEEYTLKKQCIVNKIIHMIDASTFDVFFKNMRKMMTDQIMNSDYIVMTNADCLTVEELDEIKKRLKLINKTAEIIEVASEGEGYSAFDYERMERRTPGLLSRSSDTFLMVFLALVIGYLGYTVAKAVDFQGLDWSWLNVFETNFISILIQAFPFILIGVLVSSVIQIFISNAWIERIFPRNLFGSFIVAIFAGLFFPVCDCAVVPVAARLVKKGVPLPAALTFMLTAPIINPVVIASTLYAFPGDPGMTVFRIWLGISIAVIASCFFVHYPSEKVMNSLADIENMQCNCGYCNTNDIKTVGWLGKLKSLFKHAGTEFFDVGKFIVIGAFLSSIIQTLIPKNILSNLGSGTINALLIMMGAAFVLSVCSTSDAFIARSFTTQFSLGSIMGFMVLGPMIDIKNLLMWLGVFEKKFVVRLLAAVVGTAFVILFIFNLIF